MTKFTCNIQDIKTNLRSPEMKGVLLHDLGTKWFDNNQINGDLAREVPKGIRRHCQHDVVILKKDNVFIIVQCATLIPRMCYKYVTC
jgi:hypothetical protein